MNQSGHAPQSSIQVKELQINKRLDLANSFNQLEELGKKFLNSISDYTSKGCSCMCMIKDRGAICS